jgi:diguanylate cyclase
MADKKPFEIARETLKLLTTRKLVPTPANFQAIYDEIAGTRSAAPFPEEAMRGIARALPVPDVPRRKLKESFERAIGQGNWEAVQAALVAYVAAAPAPQTTASPVAAVPPAPVRAALPSTVEFLEQVARVIENTMPALGNDDAKLGEQVAQVLKAIREPGGDVAAVKSQLSNLTHRLSFAAEDQAEIRVTLLKLLRLVIENLGELGLDDNWPVRRIDDLLAAAEPPLSLRRLDDLERRLKSVMFQQIEAKSRTREAQAQMRSMLATFVERLAQMTESTSGYHDRMELSARKLEQAKCIEDITPVLQDVIGATRGIAMEMKQARDELRTMRDQVQQSETEIARLHKELHAASAQARHDPLTGALNRKGLEEALEREVADLRRKQTPLCMALLDIDNFKKLNDSKGHDTGDAALTHLATVTRESLRAQDTLARYGGEEFVIVMPDTELEQGVDAMTRLQRALTRRFFLAGNEQILITFSAGVAQVANDETGPDAIKRADQAMYLAKRAGKNRVLAA